MPKNEFGNVDLYTQEMLPRNCVHVTLDNCAKIAIKMGIDYANACTGFTFRRGKAAPNMDGIVICKESHDKFIEYYNDHIKRLLEEENEIYRRKATVLWDKVLRSAAIHSSIKAKTENMAGGSGAKIVFADAQSPTSADTKEAEFSFENL